MDVAQIFEKINRKRIVLPSATKRARMIGAITEDEEVAVIIQAVNPRSFIALGAIPTWLFDTEEMAAIAKEEREAKDKRGVEWLSGLLALAILEPRFVDSEPDRSQGEIALHDLMPDREVLIIGIMEHAALFVTKDGDGGPFRTDAEGPGGAEDLGGGQDLRDPAVTTHEGRDG